MVPTHSAAPVKRACGHHAPPASRETPRRKPGKPWLRSKERLPVRRPALSLVFCGPENALLGTAAALESLRSGSRGVLSHVQVTEKKLDDSVPRSRPCLMNADSGLELVTCSLLRCWLSGIRGRPGRTGARPCCQGPSRKRHFPQLQPRELSVSASRAGVCTARELCAGGSSSRLDGRKSA